MERFTKGPWRYEDGNGLIVSATNGVVICDTIPTGDNEYEANAALIAAAPEMYDEIKRDIQWLKRVRDSFVIGSDMFRSCSLRIETKEKLLAKARGEK